MTISELPGDAAPRSQTAGSQTLDRGLRALAILADAAEPMSIAEFAAKLEVHRSSAYRVLRTLEAHRLVLRDDAGLIRLGPRLAALGRGVAPTLQQAALPVLSELAHALGVTAFVAVLDADEAITLVSIEPSLSHGTVVQRPGTRHSVTRGAPGHAIEASLTPREHRLVFDGAPLSEAAAHVHQHGYALSHDEVIQGLTAVAVPLRLPREPAATLAVVSIGIPADLDQVVAQLQDGVERITRSAR